MLRERGFPIADADQFARDVLCPGELAYHAIIERFGTNLVDGHGHIDRRALGRIVFDDDDARSALNAIVHPAIARRSMQTFQSWGQLGHTLGFYDAALLFETGSYRQFPLVVVVAAPVEMQLERLSTRDPDLSVEDARARIAAQMPLEEKVAKADVVIRNDADLLTLEQRVDAALVAIHHALSLPYEGATNG